MRQDIPFFTRRNGLKNTLLVILWLAGVGQIRAQQEIYKDPHQLQERRVQDLLKRMSLEEKASQMHNKTPAIERLGIPAYDWWNEALHGVARAGLATSFPQPIGLAATFNKSAIEEMGKMISDEARAKHHQFAKDGKREIYMGLTFYSPNVNIFRDPRWGRGHETFGEDPFLTGQLGIAFVKSMQGDHPRYLKTITTAKHYAVHSGPESSRHSFNAVPSKRDLWETYLPAFKKLTEEGKVYSVMCAYNRLYGEPCCSDPFLIQDILRKKWGFEGFVATDCGAVYDFYMFHKTAKDSIEGVAQAMNAGVDNQCYGYPEAVIPAIRQGLLSESVLDTAVARLLRARFKLGMFDPESENPYAQIPYDVVNQPSHRQHALSLAKESIVLLKNKKQTLPLSPKVKHIAVIGPNAADKEVLLGNYHGEPAHIVTPLEGIREAFKQAVIHYAEGCALIDTIPDQVDDFTEALEAARRSEVILFVGGISPRLEGEELQVNVPGFKGGDKTNLDLPAVQVRLLKELRQLDKPIVLLLMNGSALAINWAEEQLDAILETWYGGEQAGKAIGEVLSGKYNPAGRLPFTFYHSIADIPPFDDYSMKGRTYRYAEKPVLYPFGYGLSYTRFQYKNLHISGTELQEGKPLELTFDLQNVGKYAGDEVVQLYIRQEGAEMPLKELKGFQRIHLKKGEKKQVRFELNASEWMHYDSEKDDLGIIPGMVEIAVGPSSAQFSLSQTIQLKGSTSH